MRVFDILRNRYQFLTMNILILCGVVKAIFAICRLFCRNSENRSIKCGILVVDVL
jgi:hypothetical protein